jgi:hypothetical protein
MQGNQFAHLQGMAARKKHAQAVIPLRVYAADVNDDVVLLVTGQHAKDLLAQIGDKIHGLDSAGSGGIRQSYNSHSRPAWQDARAASRQP